MNTKLKYIKNWEVLAKQANWSVKKIAKKCGVCERTLRRHVSKQTGKKLKVWLAEEKQKEAIALLCGGFSVKETAAYLGYKQPTNFTRKYKKHWGSPPKDHLALKTMVINDCK
jgi:AraC-like DNA-binding protein